ncbi:MAG: hypothetical protein QM638_18760 [Nocardioides sp.]|uniref:hypothetical protein n=1 Tax=Nocardioides sp. TaxID=35761 RepID=UPI0039E229BB
MSSSAAPKIRTTALRNRLQPLLDGVALQRAWLRVVPDQRRAASRLPFVVLVSLLLVGGVVGLLMFNTSMQQAAFAEQRLQDQATNLAAQQASLDSELEALQDPQTIAAKAQKLGMVIPGTPAFLSVPSGKVTGEATAADRDATPPLYPHITKPRGAATTKSSTLKTR